ncbi:MAG TPA: DUF2922 domain-containing protein [Haloplasmataceae bacterium]
MNELKLYLVFTTENNKTHNLIIDWPKSDLDGATIQAAMNDVIESGAFHVGDKGRLTGIAEARYIERTITPVIF